MGFLQSRQLKEQTEIDKQNTKNERRRENHADRTEVG